MASALVAPGWPACWLAGGVRAQRRHHNFVNFDDVTKFSFEFNEINRRPRNYFIYIAQINQYDVHVLFANRLPLSGWRDVGLSFLPECVCFFNASRLPAFFKRLKPSALLQSSARCVD